MVKPVAIKPVPSHPATPTRFLPISKPKAATLSITPDAPDPGVLFGSQSFIRERIIDTIRKAGNQGHILNLGHGVLVGTPEDNVRFFFETAKQADQLLAVHA